MARVVERAEILAIPEATLWECVDLLVAGRVIPVVRVAIEGGVLDPEAVSFKIFADAHGLRALAANLEQIAKAIE